MLALGASAQTPSALGMLDGVLMGIVAFLPQHNSIFHKSHVAACRGTAAQPTGHGDPCGALLGIRRPRFRQLYGIIALGRAARQRTGKGRRSGSRGTGLHKSSTADRRMSCLFQITHLSILLFHLMRQGVRLGTASAYARCP